MRLGARVTNVSALAIAVLAAVLKHGSDGYFHATAIRASKVAPRTGIVMLLIISHHGQSGIRAFMPVLYGAYLQDYNAWQRG